MRRILTPTGWAVLVAGVSLVVVGVVLDWALPLTIGLAAICGIAIGVATTVRRPRGTVERRLEPARVARDGLATAVVEVTNTGALGRPAMVAEERVGERILTVPVPAVRRGSTVTCTYALPTERRGVHVVGPLRLVRRDPLGVVRLSRPASGTDELWVHPRVHPLTGRLPTLRRGLDGSSDDAAEHGSITFHTLREYQPGDNPKHIHWPSTARTGQLLVRQHVDTSLPDMTVALDLRADRYGDDADLFEEAVDAAASVIDAGLVDGYPVRLVATDGTSLRSQGDVADRRRFLDLLTVVQPAASAGGLGELTELLRGQGRGSTVCLVGGTLDSRDTRAVHALAGRFNRAVVLSVTGRSWQAPIHRRHIMSFEVASAADLAARWTEVALR
jgi:uncharacterized protein (DUF58 family)